MDLQTGQASRQDLAYIQTQMKNVYATQAEHADRIMRLEQRQEGDSRLKSVWGNHSPYNGMLNGNPQQDPSFNPAAEAFKNFDQSSSMMGSLHLDTDDEPRRGASRANSVRFDESAIHGHFGQASRSANDLYPSRSGSAFGSHPLLERSSSHKSEGRQSSTHSARASSFGVESRPMSATVPSFVPSGPPPGLFHLGPVPSIIRCWLNTDFSTTSLLYAVVCTGSYKSLVNTRLLQKLNYQHQITLDTEGRRIIKLPVYLPEATIQQSSSRSSSPAPQLPTLTVEFFVQDSVSQAETIDVFIGCDVLRFRNADIHFSLDRLTLFDDERNKVSVPLVRPENASKFQKLQTNIADEPAGAVEQKATSAMDSEKLLENPQPPTSSQAGEETADPQTKTTARESLTPSPISPSTSAEYSRPRRENDVATAPEPTEKAAGTKETDQLRNGSTPDTPTRPESNNTWGSWRRDSLQGNRPEGVSTSTGSSSTYNRPGRGRGMKVLKPARLNTSRTSSSQAPVGFDAAPSRFGDGSRSAGIRSNENKSPATGRSFSEKGQGGNGKLNSSNPVGGASAFGWLNPAQKSSALHD